MVPSTDPYQGLRLKTRTVYATRLGRDSRLRTGTVRVVRS